MQAEIKIPEVGQTTSEVTLLSWKKNIGDIVNRGDVLAELETDKMVVELESYAKGTLIKRQGNEGDIVSVGAVVAVIDTKGKKLEKPKTAQKEKTKPAELATETRIEPVAEQPLPAEQPFSKEKVKASPAAKHLAWQSGIDLTTVRGTGPQEMIVRKDVEQAGVALERTRQPFLQKPEEMDRARLSIARLMSQSKREIPHFYLEIEILADAMETDRAVRNRDLPKERRITVTDYILAACGRALKRFPCLNAFFDDDKVINHSDINLGLAVKTSKGLLLPAIVRADRLSLVELASARSMAVGRARDGRLESTRSTFSVSNLGMFGISRFAAIIPPGQAAILAVGGIQKRLVLVGERIENVGFINLILSVDHRVADGAEGADFLALLKKLLESEAASF